MCTSLRASVLIKTINWTQISLIPLFFKVGLNKSELLFVLTGNNKTYLIPTKDITAKNSINIGNKYTEYEVFSKTLEQYVLELEE